ncbi:hypothetical protein HF086_002476 [Spodoptera exigua]|uniref:Uncharacterized protein n=1 Tax=Spodoptera exigua TaxID=7107 RepID=A0A922MG66_SPOEX|nr:hypothetical protein HF086_002476 [Spodoptera exigua]
MVCARCQHGVYRSFISVCHMRMFDCNHDDEELELVSRNSCLLSAPYLSEDDMKPQGKVVEANDDDKILRYIICKQNKEIHGRYNKEDPRCKFPLVVEKSKYFYDYKGVAHPLDLYLLTNLTSLSDSENTAKKRYEMN